MVSGTESIWAVLSLMPAKSVCAKHLIAIGQHQTYRVEPPRKGHFGTNINSSDLSPL